MTRTLGEWLAYQERTHPRDIELGLERVRSVWEAMGAPRPAPIVITVGGTNGKGSTVALLEGMLRAAGYRTGCYTSPHLLRYNERIRIDGEDVEDDALVASFERIEAARGGTPQTYFEFGTLAALDLMARAALDVAILEVGLGGRLDAVNIVDADVAVVTTVDLDHQDWLGNDRDSIGREKAGIARAGRPAIVGEANPPEGLLEALRAIGATLVQSGIAYSANVEAAIAAPTGDSWSWVHRDGTVLELPFPALAAPIQLANAATAIAAIHVLGPRLDVSPAAIRSALAAVQVAGRLQRIAVHPRTLVDVGHNPQAARALAAWLDAQPSGGHVLAVYGALADKDVAGVVEAIGQRIDRWFVAGLDRDTPRGLAAEPLAATLAAVLPGAAVSPYPNVSAAWAAAREAATADDTVLLFGSFFVASAALAAPR
ncbi:bifunctional tetrahydrofolate synthase/dihydrofolate synthase [Luteibacter yeojuensis]|uniref:Dihydrofolate synthase/folylpolyglutamate synthase n=1 Tax=Luteibacter yeojuensis TaxID=345309 RepID=A0A7X5QTP2_9GAMM|nr:bifunctional tetrahydrofolate synthase/dihydrofolate synthase [Luteibacter yeojuensis]NID15221.1 bifunctional tetrahydrofolate synthase/dihydrofolate synthase [Luteibacter yeojuensis]